MIFLFSCPWQHTYTVKMVFIRTYWTTDKVSW